MAIIFVSYALHVRYMPFLNPSSPESMAVAGSQGALASGAKLLYVRS